MDFCKIARQINMYTTEDPMQRMLNDRMFAELEKRSHTTEEEEEEWIDYEEE